MWGGEQVEAYLGRAFLDKESVRLRTPNNRGADSAALSHRFQTRVWNPPQAQSPIYRRRRCSMGMKGECNDGKVPVHIGRDNGEWAFI